MQAKQKPDTQAGYRRLYFVLQAYCLAHGRDPQIFSLETAELFCAYMLSRITRNGGPPILVSNYFSAFNFVFQKDLKLGRPWTGTDITDLAADSEQRSVDLGVEVRSMRIATLAVGIVHLFLKIARDCTRRIALLAGDLHDHAFILVSFRYAWRCAQW